MSKKIKIEKIVINHVVDENPDLSYLGEYSDTPGKVCIDRQERGDLQRGEYRYFNLGCGDAEYIERDYERFESYNNQNWCMLGIFATAVVSYPAGKTNRRIETLSSSGLWGIESDSDENYITDMENEQLEDLKQHLKAFGVDVTDFANIEIEYKK